jgi:hypothetical protein
VGVMGEYAAKLRAVADALETRVALDVCEAQALAFQELERQVTPKKTGALADSETIDSLSGGGAHAEATVAPHKVYAKIRNDGGTITRHKPGSLGTPAVGFFGHSVTQAGSHYVERAQGAAQGIIRQAAQVVLDEILAELG